MGRKKGLVPIKGDIHGAGEFYSINIVDKWRNGAWVSKAFQKIVNDHIWQKEQKNQHVALLKSTLMYIRGFKGKVNHKEEPVD